MVGRGWESALLRVRGTGSDGEEFPEGDSVEDMCILIQSFHFRRVATPVVDRGVLNGR